MLKNKEEKKGCVSKEIAVLLKMGLINEHGGLILNRCATETRKGVITEIMKDYGKYVRHYESRSILINQIQKMEVHHLVYYINAYQNKKRHRGLISSLKNWIGYSS